MTAEWGVPTPSGHTYVAPTTEEAVRQRCMDFAQGWVEHWDDAECVPDPTWEVVSVLLEELDRFRHIRDSVEDAYRAAGEACTDVDRGMDRWYAGALDAIDEVRRRMIEVDS